MGALLFKDMADGDVEAVVALWQVCGLTRPWNNPYQDIAFAREKPTSTILVGRESPDEAIICAFMVGHDGHRGWVYYLAVAPDRQGQGLGKKAMAAAEAWLLAQGVWKMQLMVRQGNEPVIRFYEGLDYAVSATQVLEKWIDPSRRGDR